MKAYMLYSPIVTISKDSYLWGILQNRITLRPLDNSSQED
jgi:hypothetical protein